MKAIKSIAISEEMWDKLDQIGKQEQRSRSNMIEYLINMYIELKQSSENK